jgi:hypothetical protein
MTRKDYTAMAEDMRHAWERWTDESEQETAKKVLRAFVDNFEEYLAEDNARFDRSKFREACGL